MPEPGEDVPFYLARQEFKPDLPVGGLSEHPDNPNMGDVGAISESLDAHGFYGAVLVQRSTGYILAGNHRYRTAVMKGAEALPAFVLDVDDETAKRILTVDNRTTHLATMDEAKLLELLIPMAQSAHGLKGTGYDGDDLDDLRQMLNPPDLDDLGGGGGGPKDEDMWPVLRFKVPPNIRDKFYQVTDAAEDQTNEGRFFWLIGIALAAETTPPDAG